jgi:hypothetical protein
METARATPTGLPTMALFATLILTGCDEPAGLSEQREQTLETARSAWSPADESLAVGACDDAVKARLPVPATFQAEPGWKAVTAGPNRVIVTRSFRAESGDVLAPSIYSCTFDPVGKSVTAVTLASPFSGAM